MHTYLICYYDIAWGIHSASIAAESPEAAAHILMINACVCTQSEIITYYEE